MIEPVRASTTIPLPLERAFDRFARELGDWWPREYTWGRDVLQQIAIEPRVGGSCFELGPHGFRCDWGRVLAWEPPRRVTLAWHITPRREPDPNPAHASTVDVTFTALDDDRTTCLLVHADFVRDGDDAAAYRDAMASSDGWPFILERYARRP